MTNQTTSVETETPRLHGVHHSARPIWKLDETVHFYNEVLGLELVHVITAKGWGQENHPDFLHLFFDSGNGSAIAFFYYLGTTAPEYWTPANNLVNRSIHTAWAVPTREELIQWRARLEGFGLKVRQVRHEVVESIYVEDPNGHSVEIAWQARPFFEVDKVDARLTLQAFHEAEQQALERGEQLRSIEEVWQAKAKVVRASEEGAA